VEAFRSLLLDVWREACQHIEIGQSTQTIAALLAEYLPIDQVLVRQVDRQRCCLETLAVGLAGPTHATGEARTECPDAAMKALIEWCRRGKVAHRVSGTRAEIDLDLIAPAARGADVLAGPLGNPDAHCGVLVLAARAGCCFEDRHTELAQVLLEPLSVALDNDQRLREMVALREAAEADKRSLLTRLGREKLGDTIVGVDSGLRAVMERVELVARSDVPVLILGETGSGKELVARSIHTRSPRASGPFIRVNCGAIPHELIDSQLFGHQRGAFTGAVETRKGWFERADGGTLLLDEIGELPLAAQVRLLRILQDGWLERVGGEQPISVDVRIVAATHRDLASMVAEGAFREDLWYRIAVFPILLPPLRERQEDIAGLARHFAARAATRFGLAPVAPSAEDFELLTSYAWPGNVRELATVMDRAAILGDGKTLEVAKALGVATRPAGAAANTATPTPTPADIVPLDVAMRQHIERALAATSGRIEGRQGAAALLKINPHTLRARMRKLGLDWQRYRP